MIVLKWVFPVFLAVLAIVHLISCWRGDDDLRKPTKVALMPVVALAYPPLPACRRFGWSPACCLAAWAICFCSGRCRRSSSPLGTSSFFLGHVCYLIFIYTHLCHSRRLVLDRRGVRGLCRGRVFVYANSRRNIPRALRLLALAYMVMLCVLSISLFLPLVTAFTWGKLVAFFGATFFPFRVRRRAVRHALLSRRPSRRSRTSPSCARTSSRRRCWPWAF